MERLDRYLATHLHISRTQAGRLIADQLVRVNGAVARASRVPKLGDVIAVDLEDERPAPRPLAPYPYPLAVAYEDDALLVVNKPAGLVVHPAPGHWHDTLVNALLARGTDLATTVPERPGIIHRLDKDTSGLMLVSKTDEAHQRLTGALARREITRIYAVLVWGHLASAVTINEPVARHPRDRKRMRVDPAGRPARTSVEPVARFGVCDLVRARLATGRTHQIRVHLAHIGRPVVGDPVYGAGGARRVTGAWRREAERVERAAPRQALHAALLRLRHPLTGVPIEVRAEWPEDLAPALAAAAQDADLLARPNVLEYLGFFA